MNDKQFYIFLAYRARFREKILITMTKILCIVIFFTSTSKSFSDLSLSDHGGIISKFYEPRKVIYIICYIPISIVSQV